MGLWGAAQAIAFGVGGFIGTVASDLAHALIGSPALAYACVFAAEGLLFVGAARLAMTASALPAERIRVHAPLTELLEPERR
jgi:BCD family chlorophyll transporter-like MFS transporter